MVLKKRAPGSGRGTGKRSMGRGAGRVTDRELPNVSLPSKPKTSDAIDLTDMTLWIHGQGGIGKTTFTAQFDGPVLHLMFDSGAKTLAGYARQVNHWLELVAYIDLLEKDNKFKTITVDVADEAFSLCWDFMLKEVLKIEHPDDENDFGKSWNRIYTEFLRQLKRLMNLKNAHVVFVSWSSESLLKSDFAPNETLIRPTIPSKCLNKILGLVEVMGYIYMDDNEGQPFMRIRPGEGVMAKCRPEDHFLTPSGDQIEEIPMGHSAKEAYENFQLAWRNKQKYPDGRAPKKKRTLKRR